MGFDAAEYTKIPAQDCFGSESGVEWYVCTGTDNFAFMGCCAVNACSSGGCPDDELRLSKMSSNEKNAQIFLGGEPETTTSATQSATTSIESSASTTGSSPSETTSSESGGGSSSGGLSQGATIGIAVGASLAGVAIIATLLFLFWRRMKRSRQQQADASKGPLMGFTGAAGHESSQFQDMKYQSQYSPNTASFQGMQSPQSPNFTHPNSPQPYHDRSSYHPGMTPSPGLSSAGFQSPAPSHQQWATSPEQQHGFLAAGGAYNQSPPPHMTNFNHTGQTDFGPAELPASMTQQSSELSNMSELPANPNTVSVQSYSGVPGRESELSGVGKDDQPHPNRI